MSTESLAVLFGLSSAAVWGAGDFCGGLGARRAAVLGVLIVAETSGLALLIVAAILFHEPVPALPTIGWGIAAGLSGTVGLGALYRGLAIGRASIVAPVSAVVSASIPAFYSALTVGLPDTLKLIGFVLAVVAIALASQSAHEGGGGSALGMAFLAGAGFGAFFVLVHQAGGESTFFPLAIARGISIPVLLAALLVRGTSLPARAVLPVVILSGLLDAGGNVFFLLSSQLGRLDVATILSSLYPASTVILSRLILGEQITRVQQFGVAAALIAVALIAV